jgi:hypothetical protein
MHKPTPRKKRRKGVIIPDQPKETKLSIEYTTKAHMKNQIMTKRGWAAVMHTRFRGAAHKGILKNLKTLIARGQARSSIMAFFKNGVFSPKSYVTNSDELLSLSRDHFTDRACAAMAFVTDFSRPAIWYIPDNLTQCRRVVDTAKDLFSMPEDYRGDDITYALGAYDSRDLKVVIYHHVSEIFFRDPGVVFIHNDVPTTSDNEVAFNHHKILAAKGFQMASITDVISEGDMNLFKITDGLKVYYYPTPPILFKPKITIEKVVKVSNEPAITATDIFVGQLEFNGRPAGTYNIAIVDKGSRKDGKYFLHVYEYSEKERHDGRPYRECEHTKSFLCTFDFEYDKNKLYFCKDKTIIHTAITFIDSDAIRLAIGGAGVKNLDIQVIAVTQFDLFNDTHYYHTGENHMRYRPFPRAPECSIVDCYYTEELLIGRNRQPYRRFPEYPLEPETLQLRFEECKTQSEIVKLLLDMMVLLYSGEPRYTHAIHLRWPRLDLAYNLHVFQNPTSKLLFSPNFIAFLSNFKRHVFPLTVLAKIAMGPCSTIVPRIDTDKIPFHWRIAAKHCESPLFEDDAMVFLKYATMIDSARFLSFVLNVERNSLQHKYLYVHKSDMDRKFQRQHSIPETVPLFVKFMESIVPPRIIGAIFLKQHYEPSKNKWSEVYVKALHKAFPIFDSIWYLIQRHYAMKEKSYKHSRRINIRSPFCSLNFGSFALEGDFARFANLTALSVVRVTEELGEQENLKFLSQAADLLLEYARHPYASDEEMTGRYATEPILKACVKLKEDTDKIIAFLNDEIEREKLVAEEKVKAAEIDIVNM